MHSIVVLLSLMVCTCVTSHSHVGAQSTGENWPMNMLGSRSRSSVSRSLPPEASNMLWSLSSSMNGGIPRGGSAFRSVSNRIYPRREGLVNLQSMLGNRHQKRRRVLQPVVVRPHIVRQNQDRDMQQLMQLLPLLSMTEAGEGMMEMLPLLLMQKNTRF